MIRGEAVKGTLEKGNPIFLYDGQGKLLGQGEIMSDSEEKEEKQEYAPRPAWQVWGARVGLVVFILFVIYQYLCILRGGL